VLAAVLLPGAFALAAAVAPDAGYVVVAWAWAAAYPAVFAVLLGRSLVRSHVRLATYLRAVAGVLVCGAGAATAALAVHAVVPARPLARLFVVAAATLAVYLGLLARVEGITPRSIVRAVRGRPDG
jgi:hypothetical protein